MRSYATPEPGEVLSVRFRLTPYNENLSGVAVAIKVSARVALTSACHYSVGDSGRQTCAMPDGEGRVDLGHLDSGETLRLSAGVKVLAPVENRQSITFEVSSAETRANSREVDLYVSGRQQDEPASVSGPASKCHRR
jgi:hypothetical protein